MLGEIAPVRLFLLRLMTLVWFMHAQLGGRLPAQHRCPISEMPSSQRSVQLSSGACRAYIRGPFQHVVGIADSQARGRCARHAFQVDISEDASRAISMVTVVDLSKSVLHT